jgi:diguanylate cyclase (GGDEF)-like protein
MAPMAAVLPSSEVGRGRLSLTGSQRLVIFASALGCVAAALWFGPLHDTARVNTVITIPWWAELAACCVASFCFVEVRITGARTTLSLTEIPVAVGLFAVDPHVLLGCYVAGVLLGHWTRRGIQPAKDYSNVMLDALYMAVTVLTFSAIGPSPTDLLAGRSIVALVVAMAMAGWVVGPLALNVGIYLLHGELRRRDLLRSYLFQVVATTTNTSLGITALVFLPNHPFLAFALVPGILLVLLAQLTASESQRHADRMEFLYRTSDLLHSSTRLRDRAGELLAAMSHMFGMRRVELVVMPEERGAAVRFTSTGGDERITVSTSELTYAEQEALNALRTTRVVSGSQDSPDSALGLLFAERGVKQGVAVALRGHDRPQGMLLLADPQNGAAHLTAQEESLLVTVAGQISVALEAGQLAGAIRTMSAEKDDLQRRAFYDPLTQIANRSLFTEAVGKALGRIGSTRRPVAALFLDLDGFKEVNDAHGHAVGDKVLHAVATRLRTQIRKFDMVARLGGDEFGLLLDGMRHRSDAQMVAQRVVEILRRPIPLGDVAVNVGASVGVAVVDDPKDVPAPDELLRRADMAMYLAKRQGKDRYVVFDTSAREPLIATQERTPTEAPIA